MSLRFIGFLVLFSFCFSSCRELNVLLIQDDIVNLNRQKLTELPTELYDRKEIRVLHLYGNQLDSISYRIGELQLLEELYIGKNNLTALPKEIGLLDNLKILSVQYNEISELPAEIGQLKNLEQLILNQNALRALPKEIGQLQKLEMLQVKMNWLDSLPETLGECKQLKFVHLNRNNLRELPESMGKIVGLKEIYLAGAGQLVAVPESFCELRMLEILEIDFQTVIPSCLAVKQTNRLQIIQH